MKESIYYSEFLDEIHTFSGHSIKIMKNYGLTFGKFISVGRFLRVGYFDLKLCDFTFIGYL